MKLRGVESFARVLGLDIPWLKVPFGVVRFIIQLGSGFFKKPKGDRFIVFAIPKSGSTFLENCMGTYSNRISITHPTITSKEFKYKSSILDLPKLPGSGYYNFGSYYSKYHLLPTERMIDSLVKKGIKVLLVNRDIDEIRLSHLNYVEATGHHPMHSTYKGKSLEERKALFDKLEIDRFLLFQKVYDEAPENEMVLKLHFSDLKKDEVSIIKKAVRFIGIESPVGREAIDAIKRNKTNLILEHKLK